MPGLWLHRLRASVNRLRPRPAAPMFDPPLRAIWLTSHPQRALLGQLCRPYGLEALIVEDAGAGARQLAGEAAPPIDCVILDEQSAAHDAKAHYPGIMQLASARQIPCIVIMRRFEPDSLFYTLPANVLFWPPDPLAICRALLRVRQEQLARTDTPPERYFRGYTF